MINIHFGGSRALTQKHFSQVSQVVNATLATSAGIHVGCAVGADQFIIQAASACPASFTFSHNSPKLAQVHLQVLPWPVSSLPTSQAFQFLIWQVVLFQFRSAPACSVAQLPRFVVAPSVCFSSAIPPRPVHLTQLPRLPPWVCRFMFSRLVSRAILKPSGICRVPGSLPASPVSLAFSGQPVLRFFSKVIKPAGGFHPPTGRKKPKKKEPQS